LDSEMVIEVSWLMGHWVCPHGSWTSNYLGTLDRGNRLAT